MNYYVTETSRLASEIESRLLRQTQIEEKIDEWVCSEWGIPQFSKTLNDFISLSSAGTYGVLCRQVATARVEEVSFYMTCKHLGLTPMNITYTGDVFNTRNKDKVHLIKLPIIKGHSKNGDPIVEYEKIVSFPTAGRILSSISIDGNGTNLPKYHQNLRGEIFGSNCPNQIDIGKAFREYLVSASNKPEYVYEDHNGQEVRKTVHEADLGNSRPPADWYYPLYLLTFATGKMVLFETYENPEGEVGKIREHFRKTMDMIKAGIGFYPLVAEIPPLKLPMMYINQALQGMEWESKLYQPSFGGNCKIVDIFEDYANQTIALRSN